MNTKHSASMNGCKDRHSLRQAATSSRSCSAALGLLVCENPSRRRVCQIVARQAPSIPRAASSALISASVMLPLADVSSRSSVSCPAPAACGGCRSEPVRCAAGLVHAPDQLDRRRLAHRKTPCCLHRLHQPTTQVLRQRCGHPYPSLINQQRRIRSCQSAQHQTALIRWKPRHKTFRSLRNHIIRRVLTHIGIIKLWRPDMMKLHEVI